MQMEWAIALQRHTPLAGVEAILFGFSHDVSHLAHGIQQTANLSVERYKVFVLHLLADWIIPVFSRSDPSHFKLLQ